MLGLRCHMQAFSSCGERGLLSSCCAPTSRCGSFSCCKAWALGCHVSVVGAHRLSCPTACGIFQDQGSNPCSLHWQADSELRDHQGSPRLLVLMFDYSYVCVCIQLYVQAAVDWLLGSNSTSCFFSAQLENLMLDSHSEMSLLLTYCYYNLYGLETPISPPVTFKYVSFYPKMN